MNTSGEFVQAVIDRFSAVEPVDKQDRDLVRRVWIRSEYDCHDRCAFNKPTCKKGSGGWHGIGSRSIHWSVAVLNRGAISVELSTPIYTENALLRGGPGLARLRDDWRPLGALDLHYGAQPDYLDGWSEPRDCDLIGSKCWGDVTFLQSDNAWETFERGGNEAVWAWLAEAWLPQVVQNGGSDVRSEGAQREQA